MSPWCCPCDRRCCPTSPLATLAGLTVGVSPAVFYAQKINVAIHGGFVLFKKIVYYFNVHFSLVVIEFLSPWS
jgi:hypothetical protein